MSQDIQNQLIAIFGNNFKLKNASKYLKLAGAEIIGYNKLNNSVIYKFSDNTFLEVFK